MNAFINDLKNRFALEDIITKIIIINVIIFVAIALINVILKLSGNETHAFNNIIDYFKMRASFDLFIRQPWSIFTYMFLHSGVLHLLFNMLVLFWTGQLFIEYLGKEKFIGVYFLGGMCGAVFFILAYNLFPLFASHNHATLEGASAGVNAVLVAIATLLPNYTIHLILFGSVRLKYIAVVIVLLSVINLAGSNAGGEFSHLGGILFGFAFTKQLQNGRNITAWFTGAVHLFKRKKRPALYAVKSTKRKSSHSDEHYISDKKYNEEIVDAILDKISKSGYDSLNKEEKEILFRASKKND